MLENEFDQIFRDRLTDHSSEVPEDMLRRISGKEKDDRKGFLFWWGYVLAPTLLVIGLAAYLIFWPSVAVTPGKKPRVPDEQAVSGSIPVGGKTVRPIGETANSINKSVNPINETIGPINETIGPINKAVNPIDKIAGSVNRASTLRSDPASGRSAIRMTNPVPSRATTTKTATARAFRTHIAMARAENPTGSEPYAAHDNLVTADNGVPTGRQQVTVHYGKRAITPGLAFPGDFFAKKIIPPPLPRHSPGLDCPILRNKEGRWYLDGYASPDLPFSTQRAGLSYTFGLRLERTFKGGISAIVGLQYSRVNLKSYPNDTLYSILADHFNNIDLPLLIGYEKGNADYKAAIHAGIIYNIHSFPGGPAYNQAAHIYRSHTGISGYLGLDLIKSVNDRLSLFAEPYFRYQSSARAGSGIPPTQKINTGGVMIGIRYDFKKNQATKPGILVSTHKR